MATVSTTLPSDGQTIDASDVNTPINAILSEFNGNIDDNNIKTGANINGAKLLAASVPGSALDTTLAGGWISGGLPAYSSATNNGNKSYDIVFASTVASLLSPGMRLRIDKTVAGNGFMGGLFNGSTHYFTKTSPTGTLSTVTNNFTIRADYEPTAYADGTITGRGDAAWNNGLELRTNSSGQVLCQVTNGSSANFRFVATHQSLPLNKKTAIAASWSSGTVVIYLDGVSVPVAPAVTGGTAPTTAGTGGDFSVGRRGASNTLYAPGYISNVAWFDAVLSAATIRQHMTYKLLGSETNCIGAWSLDNTAVNQQAPGTNDLTATGGVGYTARSPHGTLASTIDTSKAIALVMKVNGATATVQVPEGCTIPTSGGVSAVAYSTATSPFGFTLDKGRWKVSSRLRTNSVTTSNATYGAYQSGGYALTVPAGAWEVGHQHGALVNPTTTAVTFNISPTALTGLTVNTGFDASPFAIKITSPAAAETNNAATLSDQVSQSAAQTWVMYTIGATASASIQGAQATSEIYAIPAGI